MKLNDGQDSQVAESSDSVGKVSAIKTIRDKLGNSRDSLQRASSKVKENLSTTLHKRAGETTEFIDSVKHKNSKIRNLENLLVLDKSLLVSSDKTTSFYKYSRDKLIIIDKDLLGDPCGVTIKEGSKVQVFIVKFDNYTPYLYPSYNEREISGEVVYLDKEEIWYRDMDKLTFGYIKGGSMEFKTIKLSSLTGLSEDNMIPYMKKYTAAARSARISELIKTNFIEINDIVKLSDTYIIVRNSDSEYIIYISKYVNGNFEELYLSRLPNIQMSSYDVLLSPEMLDFIRENNYPMEEFVEKNGFIEYNKEVGRKKVSVMRFKI